MQLELSFCGPRYLRGSVEKYLTWETQGLAEGALDDYRVRAEWLYAVFGEFEPLEAITYERIQKIVLRERMRGHLRDVTLRKRLGFLRAVMKTAKACGVNIEIPPLPRLCDDGDRGVGFYELHEYQALRLALCPGRWRVLVDLFFWTGHHRADAFTILRRMVDPERQFKDASGNVWHVGGYWRRNTKNKHCEPCWLPMLGSFRNAVIEYLNGDGARLRPDDPLVGNCWNLKRTFDAAADRATLPRTTPLRLRRSFNAWMVAEDYPDEYRRIAMGHTGPVDTEGWARRPTIRTKYYSPVTDGLLRLATKKSAGQ